MGQFEYSVLLALRHLKLSLSSLTAHVPIKFLQFATNVFKLVCIGEYGMARCPCPRIPLCPGFVDENDKLHLWDLTAQGQIKSEASMCIDRPVTSV